MQRLARLKDTVETWRGLEKSAGPLLELVELAIQEGDDSLEEQLRSEYEELSVELEREEFLLTLSGPYDDRTAIVTVHSGAGGTESQDWAEMLLRMYLRWAENQGRTAQVLDTSYGEEAGIKSATLEVGGKYAYGYLKAEKGVHRLVRLSPFDANHLRHTSFAQVETMPVADDEQEVEIKPDDLKMDFFRSSGPGGQNVQKVASAVRLTHLPSGIVVACQNERSQHQNREFAMRILMARLLKKRMEERAQELALIRGERLATEWGSQIRSYVLHPYKLVKDHRTDHQTTNADAALDGDIDGFIQAYLRSTIGKHDGD